MDNSLPLAQQQVTVAHCIPFPQAIHLPDTIDVPYDPLRLPKQATPKTGELNLQEKDSSSEEGLSCSSSNKTLNHQEQPQQQQVEERISKRNTYIPEALPLFSLPAQASLLEPEVKFKLNRMLLNRKVTMDPSTSGNNQALKKLNCKHVLVKDYICSECRGHLPSFKGSIFDTGGIQTYLNIKYVNEAMEDSEEHRRPKVIYENYKPKNVHEMREYILYTIDKSLKQCQKLGQLTSEHVKVLGQPGGGKNFSSELMSYKIIKKNRERNVLCMAPQPADPSKSSPTYDPDNGNYSGIGPHCLLFDSFFECGNLERAEYVNPTEYNLYLNVDTNTKGHQQWFYFKVKNTFKNKEYTFNIRNFTKPFSLYKQGMKILTKSTKKSKLLEEENNYQQEEWTYLESETTYWRTDVQRSGWRIPGQVNMDDEEDDDEIFDDINGVDGQAALAGGTNRKAGIKLKPPSSFNIGNQQTMRKRRRYFYCLTFKIKFEFEDDEVYFAYSTPYPYSKVIMQMINQELELISSQKVSKQLSQDLKVTDSKDKTERQIITRELVYDRKFLYRTLSGLPVPIITITSRRHRGLELRKRQGICISARVHPGETNSNFVYDGLIKYILSQDGITNLLQNYVFKLIPCLNPDGNVCGNYRSSLAGVDLNRQWIMPNKDIHPDVFYVKDMLQKFSKERQLLVYCDIHCHSKKKNSFIYGCNTAANGGFTSWTKTRLLPRIFACQTPLFNMQDCRFRVDPDKIGTARVIIWKEFGVTNSFTLENSFFGAQIGKNTVNFTSQTYMVIGESLMKALVEYRLCLKQIEKELIVTKGWLKPKLLLEVTGTPAAQKLAGEEAERLKKEEKQRKIEQYKQNLGHGAAGSFIKQPIGDSTPGKSQGVKTKTVNQSPTKTRNIQRTNTLGQNAILPITTNSSTDNQYQLKKQNTNQSDSQLQQLRTQAKEKRQSSSGDSTNDLSMRKFNMTVHSGETPKFLKAEIKTYKHHKDELSLMGKKAVTISKIGALQQKRDNQGSKCSNNQKTTKRESSVMSSSKNSKIDDEQQSDQSVLKDWRAYFKGEELEQIFEQIEEGDDPNDEEYQMSVSDDCASDDNLEVDELYKEVYLRGHLMTKEVEEVQKAEAQVKQDIEQQLEEIRLQSQIQKQQKQQEELKMLEITQKAQSEQTPSTMNQPYVQLTQTTCGIPDFDRALSEKDNQTSPDSKMTGQDHMKHRRPSVIKNQVIHQNYPHITNSYKIRQQMQQPVLASHEPISQSNTNQSMQQIQQPANLDSASFHNKTKQDDNNQAAVMASQIRFQQVYDTSQAQRDMQKQQYILQSRPSLLTTFMNQQGQNNMSFNSKVLYRKNNIDFKVKGIHGRGLNGVLNIDRNRANDTKHILQEHFENHYQNINHQQESTGFNGFQQYIMYNIKNENQNIQQAYSKFNNQHHSHLGPGGGSSSFKLNLSSNNVNQSFDQKFNDFDRQTLLLKESLEMNRTIIQDQYDTSFHRHSFGGESATAINGHQHKLSNPYSEKKVGGSFFQSSQQSVVQSNLAKLSQRNIFQGKAASIGTPLIGIQETSSIQSAELKAMKNNLKQVQGLPQLKGSNLLAVNQSNVSNEHRAVKDFLLSQSQINQQKQQQQKIMQALKSSRRETMTEIGAQIMISGHHQPKKKCSQIIEQNQHPLYNHQQIASSMSNKYDSQPNNTGFSPPAYLKVKSKQLGGYPYNNIPEGQSPPAAIQQQKVYSLSTGKRRESSKVSQMQTDIASLNIIPQSIINQYNTSATTQPARF